MSEETAALASQVVALFAKEGMMVATAESCTGGLVAAALTEVPGSSAVLDRGFVTYSNEAKGDMLGVPEAILAAHGAVSRETAVAMAQGALARSRAGAAVSITGIAGPGGGGAEKPVGLVHFACAHRGGAVEHREMRFGEIGRAKVRAASVRVALDMLAEAGRRQAEARGDPVP